MQTFNRIGTFIKNQLIGHIQDDFQRRQKRRKQFYSAFLKPGALCFDIGANNGDITEIMLDLGMKVIAVEPQFHCIQKLKTRFKKHPNLEIISAAVGDKLGTSNIHICDEANYISTLSDKWMKESSFAKDWKWNRTEQIQIVTLDSMIERYGRPDFCKIDVEGSEKEVLSGLSTPLSAISFEFTGKCFRPEVVFCMERLAHLGNFHFNFSQGENWSFAMQDWSLQTETLTQLDSLSDSDFWGDVYAKLLNEHS